MVNDWQNNCSLLIAEKVSMTIKVVNALICQKLIVTQKYLESFVKNALENKPPPNQFEYLNLLYFFFLKYYTFLLKLKLNDLSYISPIDEKSLNICDVQIYPPCKKRQTLFKDKTFIFFTDLHVSSFCFIYKL